MSNHEHTLIYAGVRYAHGDNNRPGSGAKQRYYAHVYFCEGCLEKRGEPITGVDDCSYNKIMFEATPGEPELVGVPKYARRPY